MDMTKFSPFDVVDYLDNEELIANCDRVLIVFEGQIVEEICGDRICEENLIASSLRVQ